MKALHESSCIAMVALALGFTSCIDEDLSDCPPDVPPGRMVTIEYEVQAQTISDAFEGTISTLDVGFWNAPVTLTFSDRITSDEMPDNIYRVTLPLDNYNHLALANFPSTSVNSKSDSPFESNMEQSELRLKQTDEGYIPPVGTEVYAGHIAINLDEVAGQETDVRYHVPLYPCVAKMEIQVLYPEDYKNVRAYIEGTACCYKLTSEAYEYDNKLLLDLNSSVLSQDETQSTYACTAFPCSGAKTTKADDENLPDEYYWKAVFRVDREGRTDQIIYYVSDPSLDIQEGQLVRAVFDLGKADTTTGVVIDTNWEPGGEYNPEI